MLAALNAARSDPPGYARQLAGFRRFYQGSLLRPPDSPVPIRTREGTVPVDEAVAFVAAQPARAPLRPSDLLAAAADDHVRSQAASGAVGHDEPRGIGPAERLRAHGGGGALAEVIAYGARRPADVIRQMIIDDDVPDRGHRRVLFDPTLRFAGVACGRHPVFRTMCVIDMAATWAAGGDTSPEQRARARAAIFARSFDLSTGPPK